MHIVSSFVRPDGVVMERTRVKEEDYVPESAGLMKFKAEDQQKRGEQMTTDMRRSRKKSLIS